MKIPLTRALVLLHRWLFNGLHSLDFPGFTERRPLWDLVILALMTLGLGFSVTGVYLAYARLRQPHDAG